MNRFNAFLSLAKYYVKAKTVYQVHSPFLYDLLQFMLDEKRTYYVFQEIEMLRQQLLRDSTMIDRKDFGAGSRLQQSQKIADIASNALSSPRQCAMMFRLAEFLGARRILEMGTSLGISTAYLAGATHRHVTTMEGDPALIAVAKKGAADLELDNISWIEGAFENTLQEVSQENQAYDFIFLDGNHRLEPTLRYFRTLLGNTTDQSVYVVDDIHWSSEMEDAWTAIRKHEQITQTIDLYFFGLAFMRSDFKVKQHHVLIPRKFKPWKVF